MFDHCTYPAWIDALHTSITPEHATQTEVADFHDACGREKDVGRLEICILSKAFVTWDGRPTSMHDLHLVNERHALALLQEQLPNARLIHEHGVRAIFLYSFA